MAEIDPLPRLDDELIDRIVDGSLSPAELRTAIDLVDRIPDGWKRCGAAFLEAQCWRESFRAMGELARPQAECQSSHLPIGVARARRTVRRWVRGAMAAGIVAASFAMGWLGHAWRPMTVVEPASPEQSTRIVAQHASVSQSPTAPATIVDGSEPARPAAAARTR